MASAASSGWRHFRAQRGLVQALVWVFALPVPVFLWALQRRTDRAPALAFAIVVTVACLGVPVAAGSSPSSTAESNVGNHGHGGTTTTERLATSTTSTSAVPTTEETAPTTTTPTTSAPPPTTTPQVGQPPATDAAELLRSVRVAEETPDAGYDRDLFVHWIDADGDGCDTRCEVLKAERLSSLPGLPGGGWRSVYDAYVTPDPSELDIDHLIPLAEAWRSGASTWDPMRRAAFANDLDDPRTLIAVTPATNRSKSDRDPSDWRPPDRGYWCQYVTDWMAVKLRWDLAVDPIEFKALQHILVDFC